ncbi:alsin-like isoform X1 [Hippocampus zosterae]|uniref:alsin-like isoform X1 n=1 Tax=Hippocampus zosterae TaxID=109293 RepID=UPI00223D46B8|nr:alsin-like isoform X1 [Hippocampus zosterae]XP_051937384.1 alsin-like isoform X1 [Hippocampus zosterae]
MTSEEMENEEQSPAEEQAGSPPQRGLLHIWQSGGPSEPLSPERVLLSQCVLQVALGEHHGLLLAQCGPVYSFGELLWRGLSVPPSAPLLEAALQGTTVVHVACGGFHCGALSEQGGIYMWGENTAGQCGPSDGDSDSNVTVAEPYPLAVVDNEVVPPVAVRIVDLACGREHSLALSAQNELWAWGSGCQLGLVTSNFPVWKPQKVEHLAGRHVIQVACGAYHSLALVRCLHLQNPNTPKPLERRPSKRDEPFTAEDAHYCPLGVELTESMTAETSANKRSKQRSRQPGVSHESQADPCPYSCGISDDKENVPLASAEIEPDEHADPLTQTDSCTTSYPLPALTDKKKTALPNELELHKLLQKLSGHSLEMQHSKRLGDADSLSSHTSDDSFSSTPSNELLHTSCENDLTFRSEVVRSSSLVGLEEDPLWKKKVMLSHKSSSLTDINLKGKKGNRRFSLPATPTNATPRRQQHCRSKPSSFPENDFPSLETEVWSWGRGSEGQLGHGDQLARLQPLCIKSLTGEEVIKVAAGSHHSLALTAQCQVYSWGSNMCGQLGHVNSPATVPQQATLSDDLRAWDVSAGQSHSLLLADGDGVQPVLLYCGQQQEPRPKRNETSCQRARSDQPSQNRAESYTVRPSLMPFCIEMGYISSVCSGGHKCALLTDRNVSGFILAIHELASIERKFYCWLSSVRKLLLMPIFYKEKARPSLGEPCTRLFLSFYKTSVCLSILIGQHSTSLTHFLHVLRRDVTSLHLLTHTQHFLDIYTEYCSAVGDFQVMGGLQSLHKLSLECLGSKQTKLAQLSELDPSASGDGDLASVLYWPLQQLQQYSRVLFQLESCFDMLTAEYQSLHQSAVQYEHLSVTLQRRKKEAEATFLFWKTHSGKNTEGLRLPQRRVLCESSNRTLTLQGAGRFSNHWFILFNDALVHIQRAAPPKSLFSTHRVYPVNLLWVKPLPENDSGCYAIKMSCPEETFILVASTPQEKNKWLHFLNQEVDRVLSGGGQGSSPGITAMSRTASYTFMGDGRFKDAQYTGSWLAGRVHGRGTMRWRDGRIYTGNFKNGLEDGYGECMIPDKLLNKAGCYQGQWRDGKIHGFGIYRYATGEVYEGCFNDGQRHGYGMLRSGKMDKTSSGVFIGQWVCDKRTGYGVSDDITRGEKYMGMWLDDERHGSAVVVTQYGVYFEGNFRENKMSGPGLLVSDDDTAFHGEFSEDWTANGKGVLSLANGDTLEGHFSGEWSTGLKVDGIYSKLSTDEIEDKDKKNLMRLGQYVVAADERWVCVFDESWRRLGCDIPGRGERTVAWENIAVSISSARRHSTDLSRSQSKVLECLECIPHHVEAVTTTNYDNIRKYLTKACETPFHPLGWLVETLVTVYRMTYLGVESNHRLLREAVKEVQAYIKHFYSIIRFLFPGLPEDGSVLPDTPVSPCRIRYSSYSEEPSFVSVVSCSTLLLPLLLPQLYQPLFMLYCLHDEQQEVQYWERIIRLNKQPDQSLLSFLGVRQKFWPKWMSVLGEKKEIVSSSKDVSFGSAVETLQQISTTFTPSDKLLVIQNTFEELTQEIKPMQDGDFLWCMDDLLPLFLYIVLRARIRNLGAEVSMIEDLMDPNIQHGELGLMFTTLKACYMQIQLESPI